MNKMQTEQWFIDRIGKRIYRDKDNCTCQDCARIVTEGLVINDAEHAKYLYSVQCDFANEGTFLNYRDDKYTTPTLAK